MQLRDIIKYVEACQKDTPTSITLYNPHSWRSDPKQLAFDYKLKPSTREELLEVLRSPIGKEYHGWKGGLFSMGLDCFVYLGSPGYDSDPLTLLVLQHITGYVYVQDSTEHWLRPYLVGDRKKLQEMGKVLLSATNDKDVERAWQLAIEMQTRVGAHRQEGFLADLLASRADGDLDDAWYYYRDLCARLGEPEVENPYSNEGDEA